MFFRLVLLYLLVGVFVGIATAFPILAVFTKETESTSASPRISCIILDGRNICHGFDASVIHGNGSPSLHDSFSSTVEGSSSLVSEEERQVRRIMDVKQEHRNEEKEKSWLTPDLQVVLWFVLLCCFTEGIASGFTWYVD